MRDDIAFSIVVTTFIRWVGIGVTLLIFLPYLDGLVLALIGKL